MKTGNARLGNLRKGCPRPLPGETEVRIDRTSVLGNRHVMKSESERGSVIAAFGVDLEADVAAGGPASKAIDDIVARVLRGGSVVLECWCCPKPCHGDVILDRVAKLVCDRVPDHPLASRLVKAPVVQQNYLW